MKNLILLFTMYLLSIAPLIFYALRHTGRRFSILTFGRQNRDRLLLGAGSVVLFSILLILIEPGELAGLLKPFSITFDATGSKTGVAGAIGFFIGSALVVGINSKKK